MVCSEMPCFFAVSPIVPAAASRKIRTICASENLAFFIDSSCPEKAIIPRMSPSENHVAGQLQTSTLRRRVNAQDWLGSRELQAIDYQRGFLFESQNTVKDRGSLDVSKLVL